jgi:hypothetical protein
VPLQHRSRTARLNADSSAYPAASASPLRRLRPPSRRTASSAFAGRPGICYRETRPSLLQAGHLTNCGTSSSNHERPHSQRILYRCCMVTVPHSSSWTSIPQSVAVSGSATLGSTRGSCGKVPGSVVRSFTTKSLTALSVSHALVAFPTAAYLTRCATADDASLPSVARRQPRRYPPELTSSG